MSRVIEFDSEEHDYVLNKRAVKHYKLFPLGGLAQAESTVRNLKANKRLSNVVMREESGSDV